MERPFLLRQGVSTLPHIVFQLGLSSRFGNKWNTQHGWISTLPVLHIPLCSVYDHTGWGCYTGPYTHDFWSNKALVLLNEELYQTGKLVLKSHLGLDSLTAIKGVVYTMLKNECCVFLLILLKIQPKSLLLWWEKHCTQNWLGTPSDTRGYLLQREGKQPCLLFYCIFICNFDVIFHISCRLLTQDLSRRQHLQRSREQEVRRSGVKLLKITWEDSISQVSMPFVHAPSISLHMAIAFTVTGPIAWLANYDPAT